MVKLFNSYMPDLPNLKSILYSGNISYGKYGHLFEEELRKELDNQYVLTTSNYYYSICTALVALDIEAGSEVILSPLNCLASVMPYVNYGLKIKFADVDQENGSINCEKTKELINEKTKVIVCNNFCGIRGNLEGLRKIAEEHSLFLLVDCFEAFTTIPNDLKNKGRYNEVFLYHFGPTKIPNALDAGGIEFFSKENFERASKIRDLGIDRNQFRKLNGEINQNYNVKLKSYGAMLNEINSYIGYECMRNYSEIKKKMKHNFLYIWFKLPKLSLDDYICISNKTNAWVFGFLSNNKNFVIQSLNEQGIVASGIHTNIATNDVFNCKGIYKNTDDFVNRFIALPTGWWCNYKLCEVIETVFKPHFELTFLEISEIIEFKEKIWSYGYNSQKNWIKQNIREDDIHLILKHENQIIAYLNLVKIKYVFESATFQALGLGNVCVHPKLRNMSLGSYLIEKVLEKTNGQRVFLWCDGQLIDFYKQNGFEFIKEYNKNILMCNETIADTENILFNRSF